MHPSSRWVRRGVVLAVVATALALAARKWGDPGSGDLELVPTIGGDTWPPVPVKDSRAV
jgi:hypothetical protein